MKSKTDYICDLFACILQNGTNAIDFVLRLANTCTGQIFPGDWHKLYQIIFGYYRLTGKIISRDKFIDYLNSPSIKSEGKNKKFERLFDQCMSRKVMPDDFNFYLEQLIDFTTSEESRKMLTNAQLAVTGTLKIERQEYQGYSGLRKYLFEQIHDIDRLVVDYSPEGDVNEEIDDVLREYENLKIQDENISTGFSEIDKCTGGLYPGELWLWVGYTGEGKTFSCINIGHHAAYTQGKNVLYLTSETVRSVVRRRLISRHARHLTDSVISLSAWKKGELTNESEELLKNTMNDMRNGSDYGIFHILQMPANADTDFVAAALTRCQGRFNVDLCILDSIHLLNPKKARQSEFSELGDMLIEIKKIIVSHNNGRGVPLLSPWHTNRSSWENAKEKGFYTKSALAKSSEAERCADVIVTILREQELDNELRGSIIKSRDGEELPEFYLTYNFDQGYIGDNPLITPDSIDLFGDLGNLGGIADDPDPSKDFPLH